MEFRIQDYLGLLYIRRQIWIDCVQLAQKYETKIFHSLSVFQFLKIYIPLRFNLQELGVTVGARDLYKGSVPFHSVAASVKRIHD